MDSTVLPPTQSCDGSLEDKTRRASRGQDCKCQDNDNKEHDVRNATEDLKWFQNLRADDVANDRDSQYCPRQQSAMPWMRNVVWIVQDDQTLDLGSEKEDWRGSTVTKSVQQL